MAILKRTSKAKLKSPMAILQSQRGVALLIAIFAMTLMVYIATEVSYDTNVEYILAARQVHQIQAYYAAKSGIELSLLRIKLYKQAVATLGSSMGDQVHMLDLIWNFPFMWPPTIPKEANVTGVDRDMLKESLQGSLMDAQYTTTITSEDGKLDINNLGSAVKKLQAATRAHILKIFSEKMDRDEKFRDKYSGFNFEELVNNIQDWIDEDHESLNGGDESRYYQNLDVADSNRDFIPANHPFKTLDELHMVAGMTDELYDLLAPQITVYGVMGLNVNSADQETLMSLDPTMTKEAVQAILDRRADPQKGGPFPPGDKCADEFLSFIRPYGVDTQSIQQSGIPLICDTEFNFRITSTGVAYRNQKTITIITYDVENMAAQYADLLKKQTPAQGPVGAGKTPTPPANNQANSSGGGQNSKIQVPKGRPTVVYWEEN